MDNPQKKEKKSKTLKIYIIVKKIFFYNKDLGYIII